MRSTVLALAFALLAAAPAPADVVAGPLRATVDGGDVVFVQDGGEPLRLIGGASAALRPAGDGVIAVRLDVPRASFAAEPGERFYGTGERSDAVDRRGRVTESYVADGPYRPEDRQYVRSSVPPWAERDRDDATYFPIPWVLSSRGWGVLVDEDVVSRISPAVDRPDRWDVEADGTSLRLRVFAGPTPARALGRFTQSVGRQPPPQAPWTFGPWFQTGQPNVVPPEEEAAIVRAQRDAGVPVSVAETQMHFLPCGAQRGREEAERARSEAFHRAGLARLVYFNPSLCLSYRDVFARAAAAGALQRTPGGAPFAYPAFVGGSGPAGFTEEPLAQFDFTAPSAAAIYGDLLREAVALGADGWMEDFGEGTPPSVVFADGTTGDAAHNRYPVDYHCAVQRLALGMGRPLVRFQRSGWTGAARCAEVVWGGDPTTVWGFDGLSSAATQVLSIGLSGVARWGTDIGGYNSFGAGYREKPGATEDETLTPELLTRWIELGALVPVMRTKRSGIALPSYDRPQVFDREHLAVWRRLTELHQDLNPYLLAADEEHRRTGLPIARHLVLTWPRFAGAQAADDEWTLGPDLLAAPVLRPGARARKAWVPPGRWVDWWHRERIVEGGGERDLPAPLGEPVLLVRAGAVIPMLPPGTKTLAPYGDLPRPDGRSLRILAVPRGASFRRLGGGMTARSRELRGRRWVLRIRGAAGRRLAVEANLGVLRHPFRPRAVLVDGRRARFAYDRATRTVRLGATAGGKVRIEVRARRRRRSQRGAS